MSRSARLLCRLTLLTVAPIALIACNQENSSEAAILAALERQGAELEELVRMLRDADEAAPTDEVEALELARKEFASVTPLVGVDHFQAALREGADFTAAFTVGLEALSRLAAGEGPDDFLAAEILAGSLDVLVSFLPADERANARARLEATLASGAEAVDATAALEVVEAGQDSPLDTALADLEARHAQWQDEVDAIEKEKPDGQQQRRDLERRADAAAAQGGRLFAELVDLGSIGDEDASTARTDAWTNDAVFAARLRDAVINQNALRELADLHQRHRLTALARLRNLQNYADEPLTPFVRERFEEAWREVSEELTEDERLEAAKMRVLGGLQR